ncbi:MAG: MFS transporter, partial [Gaiellaceae bacterium]
ILIAAVGPGWCFAINAASFLAVLAALLAMHVPELFPVERSSAKEKTGAAIREGLRYAWATPAVLTVLVVVTVVSMTGFNFRVLLPVLASKTLAAGATVFGVLFACFGAGALLGALGAAAMSRASWRALILGAGGFSGAMLLLAPVRNDIVAGVLLIVIGFCFSTWTANSQSILQLTAPDRLRGRVLGLYLFAFAGLTPIGGLLAGWLAEVGGTELAFAVAGTCGLAVTAFAASRLRGWRTPRRGAAMVAVAEEEPAS